MVVCKEHLCRYRSSCALVGLRTHTVIYSFENETYSIFRVLKSLKTYLLSHLLTTHNGVQHEHIFATFCFLT